VPNGVSGKPEVLVIPECNGGSVHSPQPTTNLLLAMPSSEEFLRSHTPELVPDNMSSRIPEYRRMEAPLGVFGGRVGQTV